MRRKEIKPKSKAGLIVQYVLTVVCGLITAFWLFMLGSSVFYFFKYLNEGSDFGMAWMLMGGVAWFVFTLIFGIPFIKSVIDLCRYHKIKEIDSAE